MKKAFLMIKDLCMLCTFLLVAGCAKHENTAILEKSLEPDLQVSEFSDSTFLSKMVSSMGLIENDLGLIDGFSSTLVTLDENLNKVTQMGVQGVGPHDLMMPTMFSSSENGVIINDEGSQNLKVFKEGKFLNSIPLESSYNTNVLCNHFAADKNFLYMPTRKGPAFQVLDYTGKLKKSIGSMKAEENPLGRHVLLADDGSVLTVSCAIPWIERFSPDGESVDSLDYSYIEYVSQAAEAAEQKKKPGAYMSYIGDATLFGKNLYIAVTGHILCFSIEGRIKHIATYVLPQKVYPSIAVKFDYLYAFNGLNCSIDRFKLR